MPSAERILTLPMVVLALPRRPNVTKTSVAMFLFPFGECPDSDAADGGGFRLHLRLT